MFLSFLIPSSPAASFSGSFTPYLPLLGCFSPLIVLGTVSQSDIQSVGQTDLAAVLLPLALQAPDGLYTVSYSDMDAYKWHGTMVINSV